MEVPDTNQVRNVLRVAKVVPPKPPPSLSDIFTNKLTIIILLMNQIIALNYLFSPNTTSYIESNEFLLVKNDKNEILMEIKILSEKIEKALSYKIDTEFNMSKWFLEIENKIKDELLLYDADKIGKMDYAMESNGGRIVLVEETNAYKSQISYKLFGVMKITTHSNPRLMLQPGTMPGQCYAFYGRAGRIRIKLAKMIEITAVTLEHISAHLVEDMRSAPRQFHVYGLDDEKGVSKDELGQFVYDIEKNPLQTFQIEREERPRKEYEYVELHILSNYGHPDYTCVYRFRVHS